MGFAGLKTVSLKKSHVGLTFMERLEKSGVQGACGPKLNKKENGRVLVQEGREGRHHRAPAQAGEREAEGRNHRLRRADQVVAGLAAEARFELRAQRQKTKAGSDPGLFLFVIARSSCDEAIHSSLRCPTAGLLRFARNDVADDG